MVTRLLERIQEAFPDQGAPSPSSLVAVDGFDQLDKESALEAFGGRTREQVARLVGSGPAGWQGLWGIEELESLEPLALRYYVEPFLRHLVAEESSRPEDLSFWLGYHLAEVARRRGPEIFDPLQRQVLVEIARHFIERLTGPGDWVRAQREHWAALIARLGARDGPPIPP